MTIKAKINLNQEGAHLKYAGRGYQPDCDFPIGTIIGEEVTPANDDWLQVKTVNGKTLYVQHGDYCEVFDNE